MAVYKLLSAAAVIKDRDGADRYYYRPATVRSEEHDPDRIRQLVKEGFLEPVSDLPPLTELDQPVKSAPKADWVAYAVAKGVDAATANKVKKDDLVAFFVDGTPLPTGETPNVPPPTTGTGASTSLLPPAGDPSGDPGDPADPGTGSGSVGDPGGSSGPTTA